MKVQSMSALRIWVQVIRAASRVLRIDKAEGPPKLPFRCGTILMDAEPETARRIIAGWEDGEERYIAWVEEHPTPEAAWLEMVVRLRTRRAASFQIVSRQNGRIVAWSEL